MLQRHGVIHAQRTGVAHVGPDHLDERAVGHVPQNQWIERRHSPVLPTVGQFIGRCADTGADGIDARVHPGIGTLGVDTHREIPIEPDGRSTCCVPECRGGLGKLAVGFELKPEVIADTFRVVGRKGQNGFAVGGPVGLGPLMPGGAVEVFVQGHEDGEVVQAGAALVKERVVGRPARMIRRQCQEMPVEDAQDVVLQSADGRVIDLLLLAGGILPITEGRVGHERPGVGAFGGFGHGLHVDVERVEEQAAGRAVGADVQRVGREQAVQRVQADHVTAVLRHSLRQGAEAGEIAHAPIDIATHRIELTRHTQARFPFSAASGM